MAKTTVDEDKRVGAEESSDHKRLLLGIDLGTSRTAVMSDRGDKELIRSVVGYPRDMIGVKLMGAPYVVGQKALDARSYVDLRYPLEEGVLREYAERDIEVAQHLMSHVIEIVRPKTDDEVCAIIGVPARASAANKALLLKIALESVDRALLLSEPFMVAYGQNKMVKALVVDIGAGTVDICALKGTVPGPEDQITLGKAGNFIDERLQTIILESYPDAQMNTHLACAIKEQYSFVGEPNSRIKVEMRAAGKPVTYDITDQIRSACEVLLPAILENIETLIQGFPPEDQSTVLQNIMIAGGGSLIKGIDQYIAAKLKDYGPTTVTRVSNPSFAGSAGALKLAKELPPKHWEELGEVVAH
jgi:rod shape-determining protein MreB